MAVTDCHTENAWRFVTVLNRTNYPLRSFTVRWRAYTSNGHETGQANIEYDLRPDLSSRTSGAYYQAVPTAAFSASGSRHSIARYTCQVISASFSGHAVWSLGRRWEAALLPLGYGLSFSVSNAWNDTANGQFFVHDTLVIHGGSSNVTITAGTFVLSIRMLHGGIVRLSGLMHAVPTVSPSQDLGALGSLLVPAHGLVTTTVTFALPSAPADPGANRSVSMP